LTTRHGAIAAVLALAPLVTTAHARAAEPSVEPSVELLAGYGAELTTIDTNGPSAYGLALGMRAGVTLPADVYLGGTLVEHLGWMQTASDSTGRSSYRGSYHVAYTGAEAGWVIARRSLILRVYAGTGALFAFGRTAVGRIELVDEQVLFYVPPGMFAAARSGSWYGGFDMRMPMIPVQRTAQWAPALFFVVGASR
jgi:hypothetical protein